MITKRTPRLSRRASAFSVLTASLSLSVFFPISFPMRCAAQTAALAPAKSTVYTNPRVSSDDPRIGRAAAGRARVRGRRRWPSPACDCVPPRPPRSPRPATRPPAVPEIRIARLRSRRPTSAVRHRARARVSCAPSQSSQRRWRCPPSAGKPPQRCAHRHGTPSALVAQGQQKVRGMRQVWLLAQQALALAYRLARESQVAALERAQAAQHAAGAAGASSREVLLLDQQGALAGARACARDGPPMTPPPMTPLNQRGKPNSRG